MNRILLLVVGPALVFAQACIVAAEESPRGTAVRLVTPTAAQAVAPTGAPPATVAVTPIAQLAASPPTPSVSTAAAAAPTSASPGSQSGEAYVVQPGDTLFALSRRTGVPVAEIARASGIPADSQLRIGQQLRIPAALAAQAPTAAPSGSSIRVSSPEAGATVRSPIVVQGPAAVFEGVV